MSDNTLCPPVADAVVAALSLGLQLFAEVEKNIDAVKVAKEISKLEPPEQLQCRNPYATASCIQVFAEALELVRQASEEWRRQETAA
jgi:hypothetical protein